MTDHHDGSTLHQKVSVMNSSYSRSIRAREGKRGIKEDSEQEAGRNVTSSERIEHELNKKEKKEKTKNNLGCFFSVWFALRTIQKEDNTMNQEITKGKPNSWIAQHREGNVKKTALKSSNAGFSRGTKDWEKHRRMLETLKVIQWAKLRRDKGERRRRDGMEREVRWRRRVNAAWKSWEEEA